MVATNFSASNQCFAGLVRLPAGYSNSRYKASFWWRLDGHFWDLAAIPDDLSEWQHLTEADTQALKRSKWTAHARVADARSSV